MWATLLRQWCKSFKELDPMSLSVFQIISNFKISNKHSNKTIQTLMSWQCANLSNNWFRILNSISYPISKENKFNVKIMFFLFDHRFSCFAMERWLVIEFCKWILVLSSQWTKVHGSQWKECLLILVSSASSLYWEMWTLLVKMWVWNYWTILMYRS